MRQKNTFIRLPDTTTYTKQFAYFVPMMRLPGELVVGVLEIHQNVSHKTVSTRYLVEQLDNKLLGLKDGSQNFRVFQSNLNATRRDGDMPVHYVRIIPPWDKEQYDNCTCEGYAAHGQCKHFAALAVLAERGAFRPLRILPVFTPILPRFAPSEPLSPPRKGKAAGKPRTRKDGPLGASKRKGKL